MTNQEHRPADRMGSLLDLYQIVQIIEVPAYMTNEKDFGAEIRERISSLKNTYGLIVSPSSGSDLAWHSQDRKYVNLLCKGLRSTDGARISVWTYEEFFPTSCLRVVPHNIFLAALFVEYPVASDASTLSEFGYSRYVAAVLMRSLAQLELDHDHAIKELFTTK